MTLKVALLAPLEKPGLTGGQARAAWILADGLRTHGAGRVQLYHVVHPHREQARNPFHMVLLRLVFYFRFVNAMFGFRPDVLHVFCPCSEKAIVEKTALAIIARAFGTRTMINLRNDPRSFYLGLTGRQRALVAWCLRRYDCALCQFSLLRNFYVDEIGISDDHVFVVPNAFTGGIVAPDADTICYRLNARRLVYVGSLQPRKGLDTLLNALKETDPSERPRLDVVGDPQPINYLDQLKTLVGTLELEDWVVFHGPKFGADKEPFLLGSFALVLPSRAEGFPNVVLEAGQYGLPTIISRVGAAEDIAEEMGEGTLLFDIDDASALSRCILELLNTPERYEARTTAVANGVYGFGVEAMSESLIDIYQKLNAS